VIGIWVVGLALCSAALADDVVLRRFERGSGVNAVGLVEAAEDTEIAVPQAIYAGDDGDIFLLDQVNERVLRIDADDPSADTRSLELPDDMEPTDLVVTEGRLYVWDGEVRALEPTGPEDAPTRSLVARSGAPVDDFTRSTFAQTGSQPPATDVDYLGSAGRSLLGQPRLPVRQLVASRGRGRVTVDVTFGKDAREAQLEIRPFGQDALYARLRTRVRDRLGAIEVLEIDQQGRVFLLVENIPASTAKQPAAYVVRYSQVGALEGLYDVPLWESVALSRRSIAITPSGLVYFLKVLQSSAEVVALQFRPRGGSPSAPAPTLPEPSRPPPGQQAAQAPPPSPGGPIAAVRSVARRQILQNALAFESIQWTLSPRAHGPDPDTSCSGFSRRIRRPVYLHGKKGQQVRGIPYCWGCSGSLSRLRARLERGELAGNVCTRNVPRRDVVGVDCSAFVSAAWGLSTHFTTRAIPGITRQLSSPWDLQAGDALNKAGSHVMLFLRFTPDRKVEVVEAAPGACRGRVCRNVYTMAALLAQGYRPVRFKGLSS